MTSDGPDQRTLDIAAAEAVGVAASVFDDALIGLAGCHDSDSRRGRC